MEQTTVSENISQKVPPKRGRPRGFQRTFMEHAPREGACIRTQINEGFRAAFLAALSCAGTEMQCTIWGCTDAEIMTKAGRFPKGFLTVAESAGRYIEATGADDQAVVRIVADARKQGISFGDIAAHFRRLRLGEKVGNVRSLTIALARTLDEYRKRFPKTTDAQVREALAAEGLKGELHKEI